MQWYPTTVLTIMILGAGTPATDERPNESSAKKADSYLPKKTPFDSNQAKRTGYLSGFSQGYGWALGHHFACPTNPSPDNLHVIRGWVEGWQAGVKDGGGSALPARYASYLVWRGGAKKDKRIPGVEPKSARLIIGFSRGGNRIGVVQPVSYALGSRSIDATDLPTEFARLVRGDANVKLFILADSTIPHAHVLAAVSDGLDAGIKQVILESVNNNGNAAN